MGITAESSPVYMLQHACRNCALDELCWPMGLDAADLERLQSMVRQSGPLPAGQHLFRIGDRFTAIYAVRSGCIKSYGSDPHGNEHVHGFHLPGEVLGFDAIYPETHRCNALILEISSVCVIPYRELSQLAMELPSLQMHVLRLMTREFAKQLLLASGSSAMGRLAILFLDLERRLRRKGFPAAQFVLPMSREDIANYLGFSAETISRAITRLKDAGLIDVDGRRVRLLDDRHLQLIAQGVDTLH